MSQLLVLLLLTLAAKPLMAAEEWLEPSTGMLFVKIPKGCYRMGTADPVLPKGDDNWRHYNYKDHLASDEQPVHEVCLDAFWMGKHEVTQAEWQLISREVPLTKAADARKPKTGISWNEASQAAQKMSDRNSGERRFRLPSEAEWEYACRANRPAPAVAYGQELVSSAWYNVTTIRAATPYETGKLPPNPFGLHDMLGNAWEWVQDDYQRNAYSSHVLYNPVWKAKKIDQKVIRGGSVRSEPMQIRCGTRSRYPAGEGLGRIGFRLVMEEQAK